MNKIDLSCQESCKIDVDAESRDAACQTCGRTWKFSIQFGLTHYREQTDSNPSLVDN